MISQISSIAFNGIDITDVDVQVQVTSAMPSFIIVGLADKTISESKERVRAALSSIGLSLPAKRIIVNLSPADLIKEGSHFDLAIAVSILINMDILPADQLSEYLVLGELALNGSIIPTSGTLPAAIGALERNKGLICAKENGSEAAWSGNKNIIAAKNLVELINHFKGTKQITSPEIIAANEEHNYPDMANVKGQKIAKRALEIAAAGNHNLLMYGSPGAGKSMLAECFPGILPDLSAKEILEISMIASVAGLIKDGQLSRKRPFRAPHHTCTSAALVGGGIGRKVKPGEISLAHRGVLFLDELPEFNSGVIEALRQPMETREVLISRSGSNFKYPANFQLIAAMNPCKCGYLGDENKECNKAPICGENYQSKISGPMLDRFDLHIEVNNYKDFDYDNIYNSSLEESTETIRSRIVAAREIQLNRYEGYGITTNSELSNNLLIDYAIPVDEGKEILAEAAKKFRLSMRSYNRILKVARTIADLRGSKVVKKTDVTEALNYRHMDYSFKIAA